MKPQQSKRKRTLRKYSKSLKFYKNLNEGIRVSDQRSERNEAQRDLYIKSVAIDCRTFRTPINFQNCTVVKIKHYTATVLYTRLWCVFNMIYKLTFDDGRIDWCTAKDKLHLLKSYDKDYDLSLQEIEDIEEITDETAQTISVANVDWDGDPDEPETFTIYDLAVGDDFCIIASTEFV